MSNTIQTIRIQFSENMISLTKSDTSTTKLLELEKDKIKLELSVSKIFHRALNKGELLEIFEKNDYEVLGNALYEIVCCRPEVRSFLSDGISFIIRDKEAQTRCRILLEFDANTYDLAGLPWEYLLIEKDADRNIPEFYIGADRNKKFDLARVVPVAGVPYSNEHELSKREKLNVVTVTINPLDIRVFVDEARLDAKLKAIRKRFEKESDNDEKESQFEAWELPFMEKRKKFETFAADLKDFTDNVLNKEPYILHLFGHARMVKDKPEIAFLNDNDEADWISSENLAAVFDDNELLKPELVILQACESGQINSKGRGLAINLVRTGIPAVVAMQNEVAIETSLEFVEKLYDALLRGLDVAEAVTTARTYLGCEFNNPKNTKENQYTNNAFGTPVLFLSSANPVQVMPRVQKQVKVKAARLMRCPRCSTNYTSPRFDECPRITCRGVKLELAKTETLAADAQAIQTESSAYQKVNELVIENLSQLNAPKFQN